MQAVGSKFSCQACSCSFSQVILDGWCSPKLRYRIHHNLPLVTILSKFSTFRALHFHHFKAHFIIILHSTPRSNSSMFRKTVWVVSSNSSSRTGCIFSVCFPWPDSWRCIVSSIPWYVLWADHILFSVIIRSLFILSLLFLLNGLFHCCISFP